MLPSVLAGLPMELLESYRIGCWYWETPSFPDAWTDRFELVDEIWAGTQFIAEAIRAKTRIPVLVMPPMVMPPPVQGSRPWLMAQLPDVREDEFVFLFQFDVASVPFRKNPDGVINAFSKAFHADEPVRLIVKALNAEAAPELMAQLRAAARGRRVSFMTRTLESADRFRLLASMDAFVSLHRSEGFGLSIAEAMAYGIPVVVTQWSGNVDFTNHSNAAVVPFDLVRSKVAHGPYTAGTVWAEPRIEVAGQLMRRLWVDRAWRVQIAQAGQRTIASTLSGHVVGSAMHSRLQQVTGLRRGESRMLADPLDASAAAKASERSRSLTVRVFEDALRFPGYYLARVHRVPWLLWRLGLAGTLQRADVVASAKFVKPGDRRASSVWTRLRRLLRLRTDARRFK
ncbi:MAG: glycosyltransferase family 1 protein [Comamonadaceae bacterium]|nr:MAG: glycosyltransferase family 1 protein [Comamonadaceae bacterium]